MVHKDCPRAAPRWLLTIMATLLVLGHACELPAYADLVVPLNLTDSPSADGHGHEAEISCDAVDAVSNTTSPVQVMGPLLELAQALPIASPVSSWLVTPSSIESSARLPSRPPLFVLHASLLI